MTYRIGIIGGDGIGPEVTAEALEGARAPPASTTRRCRSTSVVSAISAPARCLPDSMLDEIRTPDAILMGAMGTPDVPPGVLERGIILRLRFALDLYVNVRPFVAGPSAFNDGVDMIVIRENTEGTYAGEGGFLRKDTPARGRHAGLGQHADGRGALRALRVRPRPVA